MSFILYAIIVLLFLIYNRVTKKDDYFEKKGIPYSKPKFLVGSKSHMIWHNKSRPQIIKELYDELPDAKLEISVSVSNKFVANFLAEFQDFSSLARQLFSFVIRS